MFSERDHKLEKSTENLCLCDAIQFRQFDSLFSFSESTFANVWKLFSENTESERDGFGARILFRNRNWDVNLRQPCKSIKLNGKWSRKWSVKFGDYCSHGYRRFIIAIFVFNVSCLIRANWD